jgi:hypothetical protein
MFTLSTDDQIRRNDIDTLKRWLRPKLDGYTAAIKNITADNILYRGVPWPECPHRVAELSYRLSHLRVSTGPTGQGNPCTTEAGARHRRSTN